ncbi:endonuclease domain-containing protein [Sphingobium sp. Sx8-8]|uniref:endonuclease domain-containing protein n=1 Tax=Sphingobium sp. Sx8-8 TaxID=2933617 RepID=UPI001F5A8FB9|nr:endonuclease domain-containing protein [Sphingobium sp. Sx8-8]
MTSASPASNPIISSPLAGEEGARAVQPRGKVRGKAPNPTIARARELRRNATDAEKRLWTLLREKLPAAEFRRQVPIGPYFADFASHAARLIVELDGGGHDEATDAPRTAFLEREGYRVIRFWNHDVMQNSEGVLVTIVGALPPHPPTPDGAGPSLSHKGRGSGISFAE